MIRDGGVFVGPGVEPDFMATSRLAFKLEAELLEFSDDLSIPKSR